VRPGQTLLTVAVVALCAAAAVDARSHHHAPKGAVPAAASKTEATSSPEKNRDPADVALDRKIKGICSGC
jgi:hypothetical protein